MSVVVQTDKTLVVHAPSGTVLVGQVIGGGGVAADWDALENKPPVIAAGNNQQEARDAIGLGTAAAADAADFATATQGGLADSALQPGDGLSSIDSAASTKLAGIQIGATANDTDANLKDRANHTGTQPMASIGDKQGKVLDDPVIVSDGDIDSLMTPGGYLFDSNPANGIFAGAAVLVSAVDGHTFQQIFSPISGVIGMRYHDGASWLPFFSSVTLQMVQDWYDSTTYDQPNAVINADGTFSRSIATFNPNPLLVVSGASHAFVKADVNKYARYIATGAKTATFDSSEGFTAGDAFHITNRAASGDITISGTGVTFNAPKGGTLVLEPKDTVTVKFISPTEADVAGASKTVEQIIQSLFAQGQQGFWLPFTDFASLSQDSAGTLPYTALEQPVGRVLDRSGRGNHASQPTSTARGVVSARVNAVLNTDSPSAWGYGGSRFSVGAKDADGGWPLTALINSASVLAAVNTDYPIGAGAINDATIVRSIELQAGTASFVRFGAASGTDAVVVDLVTKAIVSNVVALPATVVPLADNWVRVEFWSSRASFPASTLSNYLAWGLSTSGVEIDASGQIGSTIKVRKPSYSRQALGHTAPVPFQRVGATPTDYDSVGFPKYARLDGVDDFYTCGGGGSTTGVYYSDVVRPMGGAGTRRVIWSDRSGNNGYELAINTSGKLEFSAGNGTAITTVASTVSATVADGKRYEVMDDGTNLSVQIDGSAPVTVARPVVAAGSSTITLYRGASTGYFNGQITEPIYRAGPPPSAYEREVIRAYQMQKAGMI